MAALSVSRYRWLINEFGGDDVAKYAEDHPEYHEQNIAARIAIIDALGGKGAVKKIPHVAYPILCGKDYLQKLHSGEVHMDIDLPCTAFMAELEEIPFPPGASIVQTEDPLGRIAFVLRLVDRRKPNVVLIERIFQRCRETSIIPSWRTQDGSCWISKILSPNGNAAEIAVHLRQVALGIHPKFKLKAHEPEPIHQIRPLRDRAACVYQDFSL